MTGSFWAARDRCSVVGISSSLRGAMSASPIEPLGAAAAFRSAPVLAGRRLPLKRDVGRTRMLLLDDDDHLAGLAYRGGDRPGPNPRGGCRSASRLDAAIVNAALGRAGLKVSRVVVDAIRAAGFSTEEAHVQLHRAAHHRSLSNLLGRLDAQGNVHRPRFSEVRLLAWSPMMPPNNAFERSAGSHSLRRAAAQRIDVKPHTRSNDRHQSPKEIAPWPST